MLQELKVLEKYYNDILIGKKTFEVRKNDRDYQVGDELVLYPCNNVGIINIRLKPLRLKVSFVLQGGQYGIEKGYVVMATKLMRDYVQK